ncbi:MAG: hypothetical protein IPI07_03635 [Flavobacteriales bacterium]|nr:hypothetical protein [Flavobacteriales bacterium]
MTERHLHIVSFDVPAPPDYGGVIDVYYKVTALAELGVKVHLHCYSYGRKPAAELEQFCESVHYYPRSTSKHLLLSALPYVVVSRKSEELLDRLLQDDHPILFEGLHACHFWTHAWPAASAWCERTTWSTTTTRHWPRRNAAPSSAPTSLRRHAS